MPLPRRNLLIVFFGSLSLTGNFEIQLWHVLQSSDLRTGLKIIENNS